MKKWLKIFTALVLVALVIAGCQHWQRNALRDSVEETRLQLRQQNFKTELSDFNFTSPADISARAAIITSADQWIHLLRNANEFPLMDPVGTNVALVTWPIEIIETYQATNIWPLVKEEFGQHEKQLDRICAALLAGPLKYQPTIRPGGDLLLPYLATHKNVARALAVRSVLAMHEGDANGVFTNIFALSRMVTAWTPEPIDISHMVRFASQSIAKQAIWESMQTDYWNEDQLTALQREWESVRFFDNLPETAELACANMVRNCQAMREESYIADMGGWSWIFQGFYKAPLNTIRHLWGMIPGYTQFASYRDKGSYEDEKALLLYFRDRKQELTRAITNSTWAEMRSSPGATNPVVFQGAKQSRIGVVMNLKQMSLAAQGQGQGVTLLFRAATAEATRRLIVTAIVLERFAIQHKTYPESLHELVPAFISAVPLDFMDGNELRYRRAQDGRYLLYSVGLDGEDNGGQMTTAKKLARRFRGPDGATFSPNFNTDIVWPFRATQVDVDAYDEQQRLNELEYQKRVEEWNRSNTNAPFEFE